MIFSCLYEDDDLLVINKPPGVLVHKSKATSLREATVIDLLQAERGTRFHAVHRLDRATSGVLLLAKHGDAARIYSNQFERRMVEKTYWAVLRGFVSDQTIHYPLQHLERDLLQDAETELKLLKTFILPYPSGPHSDSRYSWVELMPRTGRRHQLRRHMKHIHHPIIGDTVYGHGVHNRIFREELSCPRLLLHHQRMVLESAKGGRSLCFLAPADATFQAVLNLS